MDHGSGAAPGASAGRSALVGPLLLDASAPAPALLRLLHAVAPAVAPPPVLLLLLGLRLHGRAGVRDRPLPRLLGLARRGARSRAGNAASLLLPLGGGRPRSVPALVVSTAVVGVVVPAPAVTVVPPVAVAPAVAVVASAIAVPAISVGAGVVVVAPSAPAVVAVVVAVGVRALPGEVSFLAALEAGPASLGPIACGASPGGVGVAGPGPGEVALDPAAVDVLAVGLADGAVGVLHLVVGDEGEGEAVLGLDVDVLDVPEALEHPPQVVLLHVHAQAHHVHLRLLHRLVRHLIIRIPGPAYKVGVVIEVRRSSASFGQATFQTESK